MANRYWVGGTGVWDASNTTPWSATSGGAGGQSVPGTSDVAIFNAASGNNTITLAYNPSVQSLNWQLGGSYFTGTFNANNKTITISQQFGNGYTSGMNFTGYPSLNLTSTAASSITQTLGNTSYNIVSIESGNGTRPISCDGCTINTFNNYHSFGLGASIKIYGTATINNWNFTGQYNYNINGTNQQVSSLTAGFPTTLTITNPTKQLNYLTFTDIYMNVNPVTFYAGKNSQTINNSKGIALSDGVFNYVNPKQKILVLESGTSWTVPNDFTTNNTIHLFGGGGGGGQSVTAAFAAGGGGGGYSQISNLNLTPGNTITYSIGLGGAANTNGGNTTFSTYSANGGFAGGVDSTTAIGGAGGTGLTYSGGSGGNASYQYSGAGGGAGGPYGNGGNGAAPTASSSYGQGGGANGGGTNGSPSTASSPGNGGQSVYTLNNPRSGQTISSVYFGDGGYGGGAFGVGTANPGGNGVDILNAVGGGGGGSTSIISNSPSGGGGLYGGGGAGARGSTILAGSGANGAVIIVYTPNPSPLKHRLANTGTLQTGTYFDENSQFGSGSMYFNGSGSYLATSNNSNLAFGTNDFTIEYWIYPTNIQPVVAGHISSGTAANTTSWQIGIQSTSGCISFNYNGSTAIAGTTVLQTNRWYHVAITRQSGFIRLFLNGNQEASVSLLNDYSENFVRIGTSRSVTSNYFSGGHLSNIRFVNGTALYTANFAPQTIAVTNIANTTLLFPTYSYNVLTDYSNNKIAIINNGVTSNTLSIFSKNPKFTVNNIVGQLDEVTNPGPKMRTSNTGIIYVSTVFDEYTGIE